MSRDEVSQGKRWVEKLFREKAKESGIRLEDVGWGGNGLPVLTYYVRGKRYAHRFEEALEECLNDPKARARLEKEIAQLVRSQQY